MKILDLEGGDQPFFSEDRDTVVAFNGEIYNFRELRSELESRGHFRILRERASGEANDQHRGQQASYEFPHVHPSLLESGQYRAKNFQRLGIPFPQRAHADAHVRRHVEAVSRRNQHAVKARRRGLDVLYSFVA